ncbi:hypothetical protein Tco_0551620 [Tanacetum coccineum]
MSWSYLKIIQYTWVILLPMCWFETVEDAMLGHVYHENLLWTGCNRNAKSRYNTVLTCLISKQVYSPCIVDWTVLYTVGCAETIEEMLEIKFDEEVADEELTSKKIINFRLRGGGHSLSLLEFGRHLGGFRNDYYFNANEYWVSISSEDQLRLSRRATQTIRSHVLRVFQKMITYGLCQRTTGYDQIQRNDLWLMSMFEDRNQQWYANVAWMISKRMKIKGMGTQEGSMIVYGQFVMKLAVTPPKSQRNRIPLGVL